MGVTVQVVAPDAAPSWIEQVIPHEVAHLIFYQATHTPLALGPPSWLDEGYAGYHEFTPHDDELNWIRRTAQDGSLIPLRLASGSFGADDERVGLLYAESLSAVAFLYDTWGDQGMADLLAGYRAGANTDEALLAVTGLDFEGFQQAWWSWLGGEAGMYPTPPGPLPRAAATTEIPPLTPSPATTPVPTKPADRTPLFFCCPIVGWFVSFAGLAASRSAGRRLRDTPDAWRFAPPSV